MKNTYDEMIEVLQAMKDGKEIEFYDVERKRWRDRLNNEDGPNFLALEYRVKPKHKTLKKTLHLYVNSYGDMYIYTSSAYKPYSLGVVNVYITYDEEKNVISCRSDFTPSNS